MATVALAQYNRNIARAKEIVGLGESLASLSAGRLDSSDLFRSALVQGVAALDSYVHEIVRDRAVDIILGRRSAGSATKIGLHFGLVSDLLSAPNAVELELRARSHVVQRIGTETFQRPDAIAQAFAMVGVPKLWSTVFGGNSNSVTLGLSVIVRRRNDIVHSCDSDPGNLGTYQSISSADAISAIDEIDAIVRTIDAAL